MGCHGRGIHHSLTMAGTTAHGGHRPGRSRLPTPLRFGACFGSRVMPVLGHFLPL